MRHTFRLVVVLIVLIFSAPGLMHAGGPLETVDITNAGLSPIPGHTTVRVIGIKWDARSLPVSYSINTSLNPVPNPLGAPFLSVADATTVLQQSFDVWNDIPTSFIEMRITGTTPKTTLAGFDFVNELTFRTSGGFGAIAASPSVTLISDVTLTDGMRIDNDADPDVSSGITVATDVDGDGDLEFPAGFYKAGTILDNDVQFNTKTSNGFRFTVDPAAIDTVTKSVDLAAIAVHEFGHSHGLSHTPNNQRSGDDGSGATMFPFIDTGDPDSERAQASLDSDDIAWSSYFYPEGSAASGPAALQPGDVSFDAVYGLIKGQVRHGVLNQPLAGASVFAVDRETQTVIASGFSGTTQLSRSPMGGLFLLSPDYNIVDGQYVIPVPKGNYAVAVEAVDGRPLPAGIINLTTQIGSIFGQQNFNEEFYNGNHEGVLERRPGHHKNVSVKNGGETSGVDIVTGRTLNIRNFGTLNAIGFSNRPAGTYYAVRIPASQVQTLIDQVNAVNPGHDILVQSAAFHTSVVDASVAPVFAQALLTTGSINADGSLATVDLASPLAVADGFVGQDDDAAHLYFAEPHDLGKQIRDGIRSGAIGNLFLVLRLPTTTPFPGVSALPPLIGLDGGVPVNDVPIFGLSYVSNDGVTFNRVNTFNFMFELILAEPINP